VITIEYILLVASVLVLVGVLAARFFQNLGVPLLLLFLAVGMFAGPEGLGGARFANPSDAAGLGVIALMLILFAGGLDTGWQEARPVARRAGLLATFGVVVTAALIGVLAAVIIPLSLAEGLLLGAIVSSTDAAAVFSVLRARNVSLRNRLKPLLELESGSNDPMAVFLTLSLLELSQGMDLTWVDFLLRFLQQMSIGAVAGLAVGRGAAYLLNRMRFFYEGFYPVFMLAAVGAAFSATSLVGGSGFLAVYVAGIVLGNAAVVQKKSLLRFFDGMAWLSQITMFVALGLLASPSRIAGLLLPGLILVVFLILVARPLAVVISLAGGGWSWREQLFVSWVGLRGAAPVILATFPFMAGLPTAPILLDVVFFIVLGSVLVQGWSVPLAARLLGVTAPPVVKGRQALEFAGAQPADSDLVDFVIPSGCSVAGRQIVELGLPRDSLIVLITRAEEFLVPAGDTVLEEGDVVLALVTKTSLPEVRAIFMAAAD
jgi:cell volume regulation protein A